LETISINVTFEDKQFNKKQIFIIMEGYCVKCKTKREIKDGAEVTMKNGRKAMKGKCPSCGTGMFRILGKA
jgi:Zn finger protein HypA/HybF involved in hydrogenase expression